MGTTLLPSTAADILQDIAKFLSTCNQHSNVQRCNLGNPTPSLKTEAVSGTQELAAIWKAPTSLHDAPKNDSKLLGLALQWLGHKRANTAWPQRRYQQRRMHNGHRQLSGVFDTTSYRSEKVTTPAPLPIKVTRSMSPPLQDQAHCSGRNPGRNALTNPAVSYLKQ
jgi:hypothetical protein